MMSVEEKYEFLMKMFGDLDKKHQYKLADHIIQHITSEFEKNSEFRESNLKLTNHIGKDQCFAYLREWTEKFKGNFICGKFNF